MPRAARFLLALLAGLALLAVLGYLALVRVTSSWFEDDLILRSKLAVAGARQGLASHWNGDGVVLASTLADLSRDERIMGAAACSLDGKLLAATENYPDVFSCRSIFTRMQQDNQSLTSLWKMTSELPSGRVYLSVFPIESGKRVLGSVALVHDLSYLERREGTTRNLLIIAFFVLSLAAAVVTLLTARFAWRGWTRELKRSLQGDASREFEPLVQDMRDMAEQMAGEQNSSPQRGLWSAERLRSTLKRHLRGERVVVLANREPYIHEKTEQGIKVLHPASGLVSALEPVMRACSGVWVAHGAGSADRETVDDKDRIKVPPGEDSYMVRRVWLSEEEENGYYYGFSNEGLWPLCHVAHTRPVFRAKDWEHYAQVNRKFADAVCQEVDSDYPIILIQDYHFALAPKLIRDRIPHATIIMFWHIPWPNAERVAICPWREELIAGLLGSSVVGFHTQQHCNNFIDSVDTFMESRIDREENSVVQKSRRTLIKPYPISIEWPMRWLDKVLPVAEARTQVRKELGLAENALLGVGIDRLDYTKGIEERLSAVDELLERYPQFRGKFTFVQLAAPSRTKIGRYQELNDRVEALTESINAKWASENYKPIVLLRAHHEPATVFLYCRAAELCYVSSLHDGMNLVAKEFVATRDDEQGVLLLSQFTGAARDLTEALIVNPYDLQEASDAMAAALRMPSAEQRERMRSMRRRVSEFNVYRWAGRMLVDAAELRRRERVIWRLGKFGGFGRRETV